MWQGLIFIFVDGFLSMGDQFAKMYLAAVLVGIIISPLFCRLASIVGKKTMWLLAMIIMIATTFYTGTLMPGQTAAIDLMILKVMNTCGFVGIAIMAPSLLSDIVDYSTWKYNCDYTGSYFAVQSFLVKFLLSVGGAVGMLIAGLYGFDPSISPQSFAAEKGIRIAISWLPVLFMAVSLVGLCVIPINARQHAIVRRRLDAHEVRGFSVAAIVTDK